MTPDLTGRYDALYLNTPRVTARSLAAEPRTRIVARHGVGYDAVDVGALTAAGIILTNTPVAVRRPVATMALTFMLALAQRLLEKDRLTRDGRWNERSDFMGIGLTGRTLGLVGAGGIGRELVRLVQPFGMRVIAADPHVDGSVLGAAGIEPVSLEAVFSEADFVVVACLLTEETRHLVSGEPAGKHEAARLPDQRRARAHCRRGGADRGAAAAAHRRRRSGRLRAGAGPAEQPAARHVQRHRDAARPVLDRREFRGHRPRRPDQRRRRSVAAKAHLDREPRRAGPPAAGTDGSTPSRSSQDRPRKTAGQGRIAMQPVHRRQVFKLAGGVAAATILPRSAFSQVRELRIGSPYPHGSNMHEGLLTFAETISKDSKGRIKVNVFTDSQIGDIQQLITGLQLGSIDMAMSGMGNITFSRAVAGSMSARFRISSEQGGGGNRWSTGPVFASIRDEVIKQARRPHPVLSGARSARALQTMRGPVAKPEDVKDMRLRVPPVELYRAMFAKLGAKAVPTGLADVYLALSKGQVEGQDNGFDISLPFKWHEVAKYWSATDHCFEINGWYMNEKLFQSFSRGGPRHLHQRGPGSADRGHRGAARSSTPRASRPSSRSRSPTPSRISNRGGAACADVHKPYEGKMWPEGLVEKIRTSSDNV